MHLDSACPADCCEGQQDSLQASADDPYDHTLASCCQRDLQEQRRVSRAKSALLSVDRIDKRSRESRVVLGQTPKFDLEEGSAEPELEDIVNDEDGMLQRLPSKAPLT